MTIPVKDKIFTIARMRMTVALGVSALCVCLVLVLRWWLQARGPVPGDVWSLSHKHLRASWAMDFGDVLQALGTAPVAAATIFWAAVFVLRVEGVRGVLFLVGASLGIVINVGLKHIFGPTPLEHRRFTVGLNYPSGHVVYAVVVFGALGWLAYRRRRFDAVAAFLFLNLLMGPFRVVLGVHFVSDVLAAYLVGVAWLLPVAVLAGYGNSRCAEPDATRVALSPTP